MGKRLPIIMYHSVPSEPGRHAISAAAFRKQLAIILDRYQVIRLSDVPARLERPDRGTSCAVLTFDDAYLDFLENAYPVLEADQVPCTVFVPTGLVGGTNTWDAALGVESRRLMDGAQIRGLHEEGLVEFGSHTVDHVRMTSVDRLEMRRQAVESKRYLEDLLGAQVDCFAYPYGQLDDFSPATARVLREAGYRIAVTTHWGGRHDPAHLLSLRRMHFRETDSEGTIRAKLAGRRDWITAKEKVGYALRRARRGVRRSADTGAALA